MCCLSVMLKVRNISLHKYTQQYKNKKKESRFLLILFKSNFILSNYFEFN